MLPQWLNALAMIVHLPLVGGVGYLVWREIIKDYQHKMIWDDYKRRHKIENGEK